MKGKLIHLDPKLFHFLEAIAKAKGYNLKIYIEKLCEYHAMEVAEKTIKETNEGN